MNMAAAVWTIKMTPPEATCAPPSQSLRDRDEFILSQLSEVQFIARRIHKRLPVFVPLEDLVHSGVLGLLEATEKYDSTKQVQFKTFAQFRIRGAILDSLRKLDRASRRMRSKSRGLIAAGEQLSQKLGRQPTEGEIAHEVGLEPAALEAGQHASQHGTNGPARRSRAGSGGNSRSDRVSSCQSRRKPPGANSAVGNATTSCAGDDQPLGQGTAGALAVLRGTADHAGDRGHSSGKEFENFTDPFFSTRQVTRTSGGKEVSENSRNGD